MYASELNVGKSFSFDVRRGRQAYLLCMEGWGLFERATMPVRLGVMKEAKSTLKPPVWRMGAPWYMCWCLSQRLFPMLDDIIKKQEE